MVTPMTMLADACGTKVMSSNLFRNSDEISAAKRYRFFLSWEETRTLG